MGNGMVWFGDGRHRLVVGGGYLWLFGPIARFPFWVANAYGGVVWHFSPSVAWDRWEFGCKIEKGIGKGTYGEMDRIKGTGGMWCINSSVVGTRRVNWVE